MASSTTDRRLGLTGNQPMKRPVKAATTANITLSGLQTIDGYSAVATDRILVQNQTSGVDNGIYTADTGSWTRDLDFDGSQDVVQGTMAYVINGTANGNKFFQVTTADPITPGTTSLAFSAVSVAFSGLTANSVATSNIQASAVTYAKIQSAAAGNVILANATAVSAAFAELAVAQNTLVGRGSSGNLTNITLGTGLSFSSAVLSAATSLTGSQHRVTLTTVLPVTISDVTAAATVYLTPYNGTALNIGGVSYTTSELSLALDSNAGHAGYHQSGKNFDLFAYIVSGSTPGIGTGPAWSSDVLRGTGAGTTELQRTNGIQVNKNTITLRIGTNSGDTTSVTANNATYLGTFRTTADGQTEDSAAKRFVWNNYNRVTRSMLVVDTTDTWTYSTDTYRQARASTANQLDMLIGLSEDTVSAQVFAMASDSTGNARVDIGIGIDSTTAASGIFGAFLTVSSITSGGMATYNGLPGLGRHFLVWLERSGTGNTTTWSGDNGGTERQSGISGSVRA